MQGPQPRQTWTGQTPPRSYGTLIPGRRYEVLRPFVDYDGDTHAPGERWTFLGSNFVPYEDGLSLFVSLDDEQEWHIRLQNRPDEQAAIIAALAQHMGEVKENDAGSPASVLALPDNAAPGVARWLAACALPGALVGTVVGYAIAAVVQQEQGNGTPQTTIAITLAGLLLGIVAGVARSLRMQAAQRWQALRAAVPAGLPADAVEALLGTPDNRLELFSTNAAATSWIYRRATFAGIRLRTGVAIDFDHRDRVFDVRKVRG